MKFLSTTVLTLFIAFQLCAETSFVYPSLANDSTRFPQKNAIKILPTSILFDHMAFSYERFWLNRMNIQVTLGLVKNDIFKFGYLESQGRNDNGHGERHNIQGAFGKIGLKYFINKSKYNPSTPLQGFFVMPELVFGAFSTTNYLRYDWVTPEEGDPYSREIRSDEKTTTGALLVHVGNQYLFAKSFCFEWNFGLGISSSSMRYSNPEYKLNSGPGILDGFPEHLYSIVAPTHKPIVGCYALNFKLGYAF